MSHQPFLFWGSLASIYAGWFPFVWEISLAYITGRHVMAEEFADDYVTLLGHVRRYFVEEVCK